MSKVQEEQILLATKFITPASYQKKGLSRTRLHKKLDDAILSPLLLVTAPAGFGKTTLISEWVQQRSHDMVWLSLDESDNSPLRFWKYLLTALQRTIPSLGEKALHFLQNDVNDDYREMLVSLLNEFVLLQEDLVLILDGYHAISNPLIHDGLVFLVEQAPSSFHLVITTRHAPPFPLARMHVRGLLTELSINDLRFNLEETSAFLHQCMGLTLGTRDIEDLYLYTEGWIAGLQLAASSLHGRLTPGSVQSLIQHVSSKQRHVFTYLTDEVFSNQPVEVQMFMISTSILKYMNSSLCNVVTQDNNSRSMLEFLHQANLFVFTEDEQGAQYRYHHLFADLLQHRLKQDAPALIPQLHLRASLWFEQNGQPVEAVQHACSAGDFERAASLIEDSAWALIQQGNASTVFDLLRLLPEELLAHKGYLAYIYALVFFYSGNFEECARSISLVEQIANEGSDLIMRCRTLELKAYFSLIRGDGERAVAFAQQGLALLPQEERFMRGSLLVAQGAGYAYYGDLSLSMQLLSQGHRLCRENRHLIAMQLAAAYLAILPFIRGRLHESEQALLQIIQEISTPWHRISLYFRLARIYSEWNMSERAEEVCQQGILLAEQTERSGALTEGYYCEAVLSMRRGDMEQAKQFLDASLLNMQRTGETPSLLVYVIEAYVCFWLAQGNNALAAYYCDLYIPPEQEMPPEVKDRWALTRARVLLAEGESAQAISLLRESWQALYAEGRNHLLIYIGLLLTQALQAEGRIEEALTWLEKVLLLAEPGGYIAPFVSAGSEMALQLSELCSRCQRSVDHHLPSAGYLYTILAAFEPVEASRAWKMVQEKIQSQSPLVEKLSERELEVLQQIASGSTNQDVAQKLVVTVSTIKTHINNIYAKLQVHTRLQAVRKAQELGLIERPTSTRRTGPLGPNTQELSSSSTSLSLSTFQQRWSQS